MTAFAWHSSGLIVSPDTGHIYKYPEGDTVWAYGHCSSSGCSGCVHVVRKSMLGFIVREHDCAVVAKRTKEQKTIQKCLFDIVFTDERGAKQALMIVNEFSKPQSLEDAIRGICQKEDADVWVDASRFDVDFDSYVQMSIEEVKRAFCGDKQRYKLSCSTKKPAILGWSLGLASKSPEEASSAEESDKVRCEKFDFMEGSRFYDAERHEFLLRYYDQHQEPTDKSMKKIAAKLDMPFHRVVRWFTNRRTNLARKNKPIGFSLIESSPNYDPERHQYLLLCFVKNPSPSDDRMEKIASKLDMSVDRVAKWFDNRRTNLEHKLKREEDSSCC